MTPAVTEKSAGSGNLALVNSAPKMEPGYIAEWICSPSAIIAYRAEGCGAPSMQLTNATDLAVNGVQTRAVAVTPNHALVVGGRYLAAPVDQRAVGVEQKLGVIQGSSVTLVDADGDSDCRPLGNCADSVRSKRRHCHCLVEQLPLLGPGDLLCGGLNDRKVRVAGNDGLRENCESAPCLPSSRIFHTTFSMIPCRLYSTVLICTAAA